MLSQNPSFSESFFLGLLIPAYPSRTNADMERAPQLFSLMDQVLKKLCSISAAAVLVRLQMKTEEKKKRLLLQRIVIDLGRSVGRPAWAW